jgi:hypothetical protein
MPTLERAKLHKDVWSLQNPRFKIPQAQILTTDPAAFALEIHGFRG